MTEAPLFDSLAFERRLRELRSTGTVFFQVGEIDAGSRPLTDMLDGVAAKVGLRGLGDGPSGWRQLDGETARKLLANIIERDLAYDAPMMPHAAATELAATFVAAFTGAALYSNSLGGQDASWTPLTEATFDRGVVALANDRYGILWVADED